MWPVSSCPAWGQLVATGDAGEPYRLVDADGAVVEPVAAFLRELLAAGRSVATLRSYGMDLLRWWRFLDAVDVGWDRATRIEARDFSCWIQLAVKQRRRPLPELAVGTVESVGPPNPVTGKPALGPGYAVATIAHSETVLRGFYDFHRDVGAGPILNPFPLDIARRSRAGECPPQPDGRLEARPGRAISPQSAAADSAGDSRRAVQHAVRGTAVEPRPGPGGVLDLHRSPRVRAAGNAPVRCRPRPTTDHGGAQGFPRDTATTRVGAMRLSGCDFIRKSWSATCRAGGGSRYGGPADNRCGR